MIANTVKKIGSKILSAKKVNYIQIALSFYTFASHFKN